MSPYTFDVLSVDWDYFLPCLDDYDWGHNEERGVFFELIWTFRAYERKMSDYGKEDPPRAIQTVRVDQDELNAFMKQVLLKRLGRDTLKLYVCESHAAIWDMMKWVRGQVSGAMFNVWNLDAHHDYHYGNKPAPGETPNCGNWAYQGKQAGLIHQYHLIYPRWRKESPEPGDADVESYTDSLFYGFQEATLSEHFTLVFLCRSGVWTPPWEDNHWMRLLDRIKTVMPQQWREKAYSEFTLKPRDFDTEAAYRYHLANQKALRAHQELNRKRDEFHRQEAESMCLPS